MTIPLSVRIPLLLQRLCRAGDSAFDAFASMGERGQSILLSVAQAPR
jgi:hypothetical protein